MDGIAVHEFGHILGLPHMSADDNFLSDGNLPTMVSGACVSGNVNPYDYCSWAFAASSDWTIQRQNPGIVPTTSWVQYETGDYSPPSVGPGGLS